jgi:hypothetical protein
MFGTACQQSYSHLPQNAIFVDSAALHGLSTFVAVAAAFKLQCWPRSTARLVYKYEKRFLK